MKHPKPVSENIDEYMEEMYRCEKEKRKITTKGLAEKLNVSMPSVSEMLKKLKGMGMVEYEPRGGITLTAKGREAGASIYGKYETLRKFLGFLGFDDKKADEEACKLEHAISDDVRKSIEKIMKRQCIVQLASLKKGTHGVIAKIDTDKKTAQRLREMGLTEGTEVTLTQSAPFTGPIELAVRGTRLAIGRKLALKILVGK